MALVLQQVRECDGACCNRWPTPDGTSCTYLNDDNLCMIKLGEKSIPRKRSPHMLSRTAKETFRIDCVEWPQQHCEPKLGETADCCWQWVEE